MLVFLALFLALAPQPAALDDATTWLARLESDSAPERGRAQRWLAANLRLEDYPALQRSVAQGGAETSRRIVGVLAASERHFELAALLATDGAKPVAAIGEEALGELAAVWSPDIEERGARRLSVMGSLGDRARAGFELEPRAHSVREAFELLNFAGSGVPLVLDPDLLEERSVPQLDDKVDERIVGNQSALLSELARAYSLGFDGFGLDGDGDMAWIRVCRRIREGKKSARELLVDWCLRVAKPRSLSDATSCARALAASGWPAAIGWLEFRWLQRADEAALSGLRLAASRGTVSPRMRNAKTQAAWLEDAKEDRSRSEAARALGSLGRSVRLEPGEASLEEALLADWEQLDARDQWVRLVALELRQRASSEAKSRIAAVFEKRNASLVLQALRTAAELDLVLRPALDASVLRELFALGEAIDGGRELVRLLMRVGVPLPANLDSRTWGEGARLALCEWALRADQDERANAELESLLTASSLTRELDVSPATSTLTARLREWTRSGERESLTRLLAEIEGTEVVRAHLGLLEREALNALRSDLLKRGGEGNLEPAELETLASFAAGTRGEEVLKLLVGAAADVEPANVPGARSDTSTQEAVDRALDEAVRVLRAARLDEQLDSFVQRIRRVRTAGTWPAPPARRATPLRLFERRFEP